MRYEGNQVVITESELHDLVNESVKLYLNENAEDETFWGGLKNAAYGFGRGNWNVRQNFKVGNQASSFNKYATTANNAISKMMEIAKETQNATIATSLNSIYKNIQKVADAFTKEAKRLAGPQDYRMTVNNPWKKPAARKTATGAGTTTIPQQPPVVQKTGKGGRKSAVG